MEQQKNLYNGPAAAAILAAGISCMALGLFTTLAQAIGPLKKALNLYDPAGPLSGKTTFAVVAWLAAWIIFGILWKNKQVGFARVFIASLVLIALGLIGTFPPFFEMFGH
ncbi:MAG: hypothetical protein A2W19_01555 [Spirochaetes bacterium RBG_16_49_21]|nr:MAG: hypothetical protein A2W19_01555 [Spirochaetes bacterium RBG_16_49_21]